MTGPAFDPALMFVTDPGIGSAEAIEAMVAAAIRGGATSIQLRDKDAADEELTALARRLLALTRPLGVPLIVNDRATVAVAAGADGLHIGEDDLPPEEARRLLPPGRILGLSVTRAETAARADPRLVDYAGLGPVFATPSKADAAPPIGLDGVTAIRRSSPSAVSALPTPRRWRGPGPTGWR
jgi:thiamine-phosphate pyrophosphorylase